VFCHSSFITKCFTAGIQARLSRCYHLSFFLYFGGCLQLIFLIETLSSHFFYDFTPLLPPFIFLKFSRPVNSTFAIFKALDFSRVQFKYLRVLEFFRADPRAATPMLLTLPFLDIFEASSSVFAIPQTFEFARVYM